MTRGLPSPGSARLGVILAHYHTPDLLERAVVALRADLAGSGLQAEVIVVDNGSDRAGQSLLKALPVRYLDARDNPGYAAALNLGINCSDADRLVLMNPDVMVLPGCLSALMRALHDGADCAGPRFYWDENKRFMLPPTEQRTRRAELRASLGDHGGALGRWARGHWRSHARRFWTARQTFESKSLSGALLAIRRRAVERVGLFDERFRLYFEEHDWIIRLARAGMTAVHVPEAEAVHLFNRSAAQEPAAPRWFAQSRELFFNRYYGAWFRRLLACMPKPSGRASREPDPLASGPPCIELPTTAGPEDWPLWVEISSSARRFPAAVAVVRAQAEGSFRFPAEIWRRLAPGRYFLTVADRAGRELAAFSFDRPRE